MENKTQTVHENILEIIEMDGKTHAAHVVTENEDTYYRRLIQSVGSLSDTAWSKLAEPSQTWYNNAAAASNAMQPIPPCPGFQMSHGVVATAVETATNGAASEAPAKRGRSGGGVMQRALQISLLNPSMDYKGIMEVLSREGVANPSENTVWTCWKNAQDVIRAAKAVNMELTPIAAAAVTAA